MNLSRFDPHSHTMYSNIKLLDCINRPEKLIDRAIEIGLKGIAITDHDCLSSHVKVNKYAQSLYEKHPDFKVALGNEIYLCPDRSLNQKYYHFILIAKNAKGHKALRELSSRAWMNSYFDRGMERVVTTYQDLVEIYQKYPNSLIGTTACLGGELSSQTLKLIQAEKVGDAQGRQEAHNNIVNFILFCKNLFNEDFYIEVAPGCSKEQIQVNQRLASIADCFNLNLVAGSDAHYLKKEDRYVHKAYLNSKGGEREVDDFYEYAYLQDEEDIIKNLSMSFNQQEIETMFSNSMTIYDKIVNYSLYHSQQIPKVEVEDYPPCAWWGVNNDYADEMSTYPVLKSMFTSKDKIERYWVNQCWNKLKEESKIDNFKYIQALEEEARVKRVIGEKLETNMFQYPVTLQHYIDLIWECGSPVGAGRGSACAALNHYLLGVTQLDPIEWNLPFFRYLNEERTELGDVDIDVASSRRPTIIKEIKKERKAYIKDSYDDLTRNNLGCTLVATFGTESTKSTILTACRGYRSEEYPDGIDVDTAQFLSSLVPQERGFLWSLEDMLYGDKEKGRKPIKMFITEVEEYPGLIEIMLGIQNLVNKRSSHASGVIMFDEDPYEFGCFMRTPKGEIITQYDLHDAEYVGMTKYDILITEIQDKILETIKMLQEDNQIEKDLTLREVYNKYLHPNVLPIDNEKVWDNICDNKILNLFQFDSDVGSQAAKKIRPRNIIELCDSNGLMRLMTQEKGAETPMEKYIRFKNDISLWYKEMNDFGLTKEEQKILEPYFLKSYGVPPSQEQMMTMLMDKDICGFSLADANTARKVVGKKQMSKIPELKNQVLTLAKGKKLGEYVWQYGIGPQMG